MLTMTKNLEMKLRAPNGSDRTLNMYMFFSRQFNVERYELAPLSHVHIKYVIFKVQIG